MAQADNKTQVRRELLERALEDNAQQKRSFLDLETGEIVSVYLDMIERGADQTAKRIANGVNTRYILIPNLPARDSFQEMERFIASVADKKLAVELKKSLESDGPFRKFRDALFHHKTELDRWEEMRATRVAQTIAKWIVDKKLEDRIELV